MKYRKLRIAWSVGWGIAAVLMCLLWVRSYWVHHTLSFNYGTSSVDITSHDGYLNWIRVEHDAPLTFGWHLSVNYPDNKVHQYMMYVRPQIEKSPQREVRYWHLAAACVIAAIAPFATIQWRNFKRRSRHATTLVAVADCVCCERLIRVITFGAMDDAR